MIKQYTLTLSPFSRGFHLITDDILSYIGRLPEHGFLHVFIQHTTAGLSINENTDPRVRHDFESFFNYLVPEDEPYYTHTTEGPDDMPSHIKSSLVGSSLMIPVTNHKLNLGTWQGIYLCEFRNNGGRRNLVVTIYE